MVKKLFQVVIILLLSLILASCDIGSQNVDIIDLINNFDYTEYYGFEYSTVQYDGENILNSDSIIQKVNIGRTQGETTHIKKRLINYNSELNDPYEIEETINYYKDNQRGYYIGGELVWEDYLISEYELNYFPITKLDLEDFILYNIKESNNNQTLEGEIKTTSFKKVLNNDFSNIKSIKLEILYNKNIISVKIRVEQTSSFTLIEYKPYLTGQQVIIN
jgi:hypothetical protein